MFHIRFLKNNSFFSKLLSPDYDCLCYRVVLILYFSAVMELRVHGYKIKKILIGLIQNMRNTGRFFLNCYLTAPRPTLDHSQGNSFTNLMLITEFWLFLLEGHQEPRREVGSLSPAERLVGFELGTFRFNHNASTHFATLPWYITSCYTIH